MREKRSYKLGGTISEGDVNAMLATCRGNASKAARRLGVDVRTIQRWLKDRKVRRPTTRPRRNPGTTDIKPANAAPCPTPDAPVTADSPETWAKHVREKYDLTPTEHQLLALAEEALRLSQSDAIRITEKLAAMARFSALVRELDLEDDPADGKTKNENPFAIFPRRIG